MSRERLEIDREQLGALVARHAGGRLVEQQHLRPGRERERDLEQALAAVGKLARRRGSSRRRACSDERIACASSTAVADRPATRCHQVRATPSRSHTASVTASSALRLGNSVLIWNVRTSPRLTRLSGGSAVMSSSPSRICAGVGPQHAGHQVDQRGLAGAVRADQRVARALRQLERDVLRDDERAEALVEPARGQRRAHDVASRARRHEPASIASPPRIPFGRNITTAISSMPIQKYQNCGVVPENWSRATMKMMAPTSPP